MQGGSFFPMISKVSNIPFFTNLVKCSTIMFPIMLWFYKTPFMESFVNLDYHKMPSSQFNLVQTIMQRLRLTKIYSMRQLSIEVGIDSFG